MMCMRRETWRDILDDATSTRTETRPPLHMTVICVYIAARVQWVCVWCSNMSNTSLRTHAALLTVYTAASEALRCSAGAGTGVARRPLHAPVTGLSTRLSVQKPRAGLA